MVKCRVLDTCVHNGSTCALLRRHTCTPPSSRPPWCRAKHFAVDAAAVAHMEDGIADDDFQPSYGNSAREAVSKQVAMAFDSIFFEAKPRLIPVLNHQKVHLELIKWDRLHQQLELVEVRRFGLNVPCFCTIMYRAIVWQSKETNQLVAMTGSHASSHHISV